MKQSVKFTLLVVLLSAYFVQAQDEETPNPGNDGDTFDLTDEIFQNSSSQSDLKRVGRASGDALIADYPYVVFIKIVKILQTTPTIVTYTDFVSGAIISNTEVVTAASIFNIQLASIEIRAGTNYGLNGGTVFSDISYKIHPSYDSVTGENDVAIITLNSGTFSGLPDVKPIAAETSVLGASTLNPINCFIVGAFSQYLLKRADYTLITDAACAASMKKIVPASVQCATGDSRFGCYMSIGNPVVCNNRLYGILQAAPKCPNDSTLPTHSFAKIPASSIKSFLFPKKSYFACPCNSC